MQKPPKKLLGEFTLPDGSTAFGELKLKSKRTNLYLSCSTDLNDMRSGHHLYGTSLDRKRISCLNCIVSGTGRTFKGGDQAHCYANVFPHYVVVGERHLRPDELVITQVGFTVDNLDNLFYDFDTFGNVIYTDSIIETILDEKRKYRPVEAGKHPIICYYTGKSELIKADTVIGSIKVSNNPTSESGSAKGISIENKVRISIKWDEPITFTLAMERAYALSRFLSIAAGKKQWIRDLCIYTDDLGPWDSLNVHWSNTRPSDRASTKDSIDFRDVPLDPITRQAEFIAVLQNWFRTDNDRRVARNQYISCISKDNFYDADRIVAAANAFDILPADATPTNNDLPSSLAEARSECLRLLRVHPASPDRDSAIAALSRMGKPSLRKKILFRVSIIQSAFGGYFDELDLVATTAVKCRNFFVHGADPSEFDYNQLERFFSFLTESLEFIFAASDLIEAGWEPLHWLNKGHTQRHKFSSFIFFYKDMLPQLKAALKKP